MIHQSLPKLAAFSLQNAFISKKSTRKKLDKQSQGGRQAAHSKIQRIDGNRAGTDENLPRFEIGDGDGVANLKDLRPAETRQHNGAARRGGRQGSQSRPER